MVRKNSNRFDQPNNDQSKANHFSHPHPLTLIDTKNQQTQITNYNLSTCAGCKLKPSGSIYSCSSCSFFLHRKCFQMPKMLKHPGHKDHVFALLSEPAYASGGFQCDACHEPGNGFSYHCKPCGMDLHILCAVMPQSITNACHNHELKMGYECPYYTKSFLCDICKSSGYNHWLYSCGSCGFDAHLKCATGLSPQQKPNNNMNNDLSAMFSGLGTNNNSPLTSFGSHLTNLQNITPLNSFGSHLTNLQNNTPLTSFGSHLTNLQNNTPLTSFGSHLTNLQNNTPLTSFGSHLTNLQNNNSSLLNNPMMNNQGFGSKPDATTAYNQILQQIMDQYKRDGTSQITQRTNETMAFLQQIIDQNKQGAPDALVGGPSGNSMEVQQFMDYINSLGNNDNGAVGGGVPGSEGAFGGGNMDFLQGLMNNGGAGTNGLDALQSLLGGGNNNGIDFLNGLNIN